MTRTNINNRAKIKSIVYLYHHYETIKKNIFPHYVMQAKLLTPFIFIAQHPQIPSRQDFR